METEKRIRSILESVVAEKGYELAQVRLFNNKNGLNLEVLVDRDDPISLEDIVAVSEAINAALDAEDPISSPYTVDVSSLGAEKPIPIERLPRYVGRYVNLHLRNGIRGSNTYEGDLVAIEEDNVILHYKEKTRTKDVIIPINNIDKARLAIKF